MSTSSYETEMPVMQATNFTSLPGFSRLFTDFIGGSDVLMSRFPGNASAAAIDTGTVSKRLARSYDRAALVEAARLALGGTEPSEAQQESLRALAEEHTAVVVTGQQAGLLGGPLYTLFKAMSAVAVARDAERQHGVRCVPVFWVEDNDHDFEEIAQAVVLNRDGAAVSISCAEPATDVRVPIGLRTWSTASPAVEALAEALQPTDFTESLLAAVRSAYADGQRISQSFIQMLNTIVAPTGMLFLSACDLQQRGMMAPLLRRVVEEHTLVQAALAEGVEQLRSQQYHIQAEPLPINAMLIDGGKRYRIDPDGSGVRAGDKHYSLSEVQALIASEPERFSPSVLTRPVVQDAILPSIAYIAGPGEMGYAAELKELYAVLNIPMPAFVPRHSLTLLERRFAAFLEERGLAPELLFRPIEHVEKEFVASIENRELSLAFTAAEQSIREVFEGLQEKIAAVDATLVATTGKTMTSALQQLEQLAARAVRAQKKQEEGALSKLRQAHTALFPAHVLQERALGWLYFANKFGCDTLRAVVEESTTLAPVQHFFPVIAFRRFEQPPAEL